MPQIELAPKTTKVYSKLYYSPARIDVSRGGTRSSKTFSWSQLGINWLMTGQYGHHLYLPDGKASVVRKYLPALKATVLQDILEIMHDCNIYKYVDHHKTDKIFSFEGRQLDYFSADDEQKVRGRKRNILFCNEGNELVFKKEFQQLLLRTTDKVVVDFNPDDPDIWINQELEIKRAQQKGDVNVIISTYKDNQFLDKETIEEIEWLEKVDPELWQVFGKGEYGKITGLIYPRATLIKEFPWELSQSVVYGIDWGYINPTSLVRVGIDDFNRKLYLQELYYKREKNVQDLVKVLPSLGVRGNDLIYCDSNRPSHIVELYNSGYRGAKPAKKGAGSVEDGINKMKSYELCITQDSVNLINERKKYKWALDKNGEPIDGKPMKDHDHGLDGCRYALYTHTYKKKRAATRAHK